MLPGSVAEPPLFWAAPASDGQGPGADSGADLLGLAPAPGKKSGSRRLRLRNTAARYRYIVHIVDILLTAGADVNKQCCQVGTVVVVVVVYANLLLQ